MKRQDSILEIMKKQADQAQESQQQMLQQQQLMNQALVSVMEKLISKWFLFKAEICFFTRGYVLQNILFYC